MEIEHTDHPRARVATHAQFPIVGEADTGEGVFGREVQVEVFEIMLSGNL
jgi:hypothetical protein